MKYASEEGFFLIIVALFHVYTVNIRTYLALAGKKGGSYCMPSRQYFFWKYFALSFFFL